MEERNEVMVNETNTLPNPSGEGYYPVREYREYGPPAPIMPVDEETNPLFYVAAGAVALGAAIGLKNGVSWIKKKIQERDEKKMAELLAKAEAKKADEAQKTEQASSNIDAFTPEQINLLLNMLQAQQNAAQPQQNQQAPQPQQAAPKK